MENLFCDLRSDEEKANFFLSGRAYETGVIAKAIQNDVAMAYHRCAEFASDLATAEQDSRQKQARIERLEAAVKELWEALSKTSGFVPKYYYAYEAAIKVLKNTENI